MSKLLGILGYPFLGLLLWLNTKANADSIVHPKYFSGQAEVEEEQNLLRNYEIVLFDTDKKTDRRITENNVPDGFPFFTKDGKFVVFSSWPQGEVVFGPASQPADRQGPVMKKISIEELVESEVNLNEVEFHDKQVDELPIIPFSSWLDNNNLLLAQSAWMVGYSAYENFDSANGKCFVYRFNISNGKIDRLLNIPGVYGFPTPSPDRKKVVFSLVSKLENEDYSVNLYVSDIDGSNRKRLVSNYERGRFSGEAKDGLEWLYGMSILPTWSPDGKGIAYVSGKTGNLEIWKVDVETDRQTQLTSGKGEKWLPLWRKNGIYFVLKISGEYDSEELRAYKKHESSEQGIGNRQIWLMDSNGNNQRKITDTTNLYYGTYDVFDD